MVFSKFHKLHQKFSINLLTPHKEKKILKLLDCPPTNLYIGRDECLSSIVHSCEEEVGVLMGEGYSVE